MKTFGFGGPFVCLWLLAFCNYDVIGSEYRGQSVFFFFLEVGCIE